MGMNRCDGWWLAMGVAMLVQAGAAAGGTNAGAMSGLPAVRPAAKFVPQSSRIEGGTRKGGWNGVPSGRWHHRRDPGVQLVYSSMYEPVAGDEAAADGRSVDSQAATSQIRFVPVPVPFPVPVAPPVPPKPSPIVRYASGSQAIDIPRGAHVSRGSVYKYEQAGVSVYTDNPPANAHATHLFEYTEAVMPAGAP